MQSWTDQQLALLRPRYPGWQIWVVHAVYGPDTWCARPAGHPVAVINAHSPEELVKAIAEYERG